MRSVGCYTFEKRDVKNNQRGRRREQHAQDLIKTSMESHLIMLQLLLK